MSFLKNLINPKPPPSPPPFPLQKLLYKRYQPRPPLPHPLSPLIITLFHTIERSFLALSSDCGEQSPSVSEAMKDYRLLMTRYEARDLPSDIAKLEERGGGYEEVYGCIFVTLAETVFQIYKIVTSVHGAGAHGGDVGVEQLGLVHVMELIGEYALAFGFATDGERLFGVERGGEDYGFLYGRGGGVDGGMERALCGRLRELRWGLQRGAEEVMGLV